MLLLPARSTFRAFSFGGGVQSTAVLVMQARGLLRNPYDVFVFANVGEDSENPATIEYIEKYSKPYAAANGIAFVELRKTTRGRGNETLLEWVGREERSIRIPVHMANGSPGRRSCTETFKIDVIDRWIRQQNIQHVVMGLGISLDEYWRARDVQWQTHQGKKAFGFAKRREYPLIDARMNRVACLELIQSAGLPLPPKSSCWFCPFKKRSDWQWLHDHAPELFLKTVKLEKLLNARRLSLGKDRVYFHPSLVPLDQAVGIQFTLFSDEEMDRCDSGHCNT